MNVSGSAFTHVTYAEDIMLFAKASCSEVQILDKCLVTYWDSPCMNALRSKYKVKEGWIHKEPLKNSFPTWRAIERLKPIIRKGACFIIGDGSKVDY
jgi:hypothetical protein